jgi:predicted NAD-dependent protein-ADP-ribosyltransferase YbiA (DUF1768 family)
MVLSKISKKDYNQEDIYVDSKDLDQDSYIYNGTIYGKPIQFVLGLPHIDNDGDDFTIIYVYLVKDEEVIRKIGVIEFETEKMQGLYDENGDFILDDKTDIMKNNCTLFPNAKTFIKTKYNIEIIQKEDIDSSSDEESSDLDQDLDQDLDKDLDQDLDQDLDKDSKSKKDEETIVVKEHTKDDHLFEVAEYEKNKSKHDLWINKFFKSKKYDIDRVPGDGDCFFSAFVKAYNDSKYKNKDKICDKSDTELQVKNVRKFLSEIADQELLNKYKEIYGTTSEMSKSSKEKMLKGGKIHSSLKAQIGGTSDLEVKKELISSARSNIEEISKQKSISSKSSEIMQEFNFMRDINTLEQLKDMIKSKEFYADAWAIPNIEKKYNVKFIILNEELFIDSADAENSNILQCGDAHPDLQRQGFVPDMYIILNYSGNIHYDLITYDKNYFISSFKFKELPYIVKKTIVETCYEKDYSGQGAFSLIEDVKDFARIEGLQTQQKPNLVQELREYKGEEGEEGKEGKDSLVNKLPKATIENNIVLIIGKNLDKLKKYPVGKINNTFKYQFNCSKNSKDEAQDKEVVLLFKDNKKELEKYFYMCNKLDSEKEWRTKLDNHYEMSGGINIDGKNYKSVQQYIDKIDNSKENRLKAIKAKFEQHQDLRRILLYTQNYLIKIREPEEKKRGRISLKEDAIESDINNIAYELMEVRKYFQSQTQTLEK